MNLFTQPVPTPTNGVCAYCAIGEKCMYCTTGKPSLVHQCFDRVTGEKVLRCIGNYKCIVKTVEALPEVAKKGTA